MPDDRGGPPRIAVVEDDDDFRQLLRLWLGREFTVACFRSADAFLAECELLRPDLVLLDFGLPRMNGLEVARELRARSALRALPIILITAMPLERMDLPGLIRHGISEFVAKPIDYARLLDCVRRLTSRAVQPPPCFQKPAG